MSLVANHTLFFTNMLSLEWRIFYTCVATIIINLPFGYLRGGLQKLSLCWFIAIHAPVPLVILIRQFHSLELTWSLAPFLLGSFFMGQFLGRKIWSVWPYRKSQYSCIFKKNN
ncbi:hypothetical protein SAMN05444274_10957 [Mariniphaga anaerophila]|uniref:Uncharacterized protein n=1 Tax=Mariniphaga anaerophila TaxID=1484053 RepID=A0A1M5EJ61_9BACT|nr:hypothetical protein [Mariniphaga anaerophila]SHF79237.1 hypothetical protein SAMN05444274_10957 [Mariniphaga anaerophila]